MKAPDNLKPVVEPHKKLKAINCLIFILLSIFWGLIFAEIIGGIF